VSSKSFVNEVDITVQLYCKIDSLNHPANHITLQGHIALHIAMSDVHKSDLFHRIKLVEKHRFEADQ
jgi:hypothetical protein